MSRQKLAPWRAWLHGAGGAVGLPVQVGVPASRFCKKYYWKWTRIEFQRRWSLPVAQLTPPRLRWLV